MRVIAGEFRSRRLKSIPGDATRPTPDRLRETLFDILAARVAGRRFPGCLRGDGSGGDRSAQPRGAARHLSGERPRRHRDHSRQSGDRSKLERRATVVKGAVLLTLGRSEAEIVFLDPPYGLEREYKAALELLGEAPPPMTVVQHSVRLALADSYGALRRTRVVKQGDNALSMLCRTFTR
jgi:16S rRNA (guanine966-N2)-methyltransferase